MSTVQFECQQLLLYVIAPLFSHRFTPTSQAEDEVSVHAFDSRGKILMTLIHLHQQLNFGNSGSKINQRSGKSPRVIS